MQTILVAGAGKSSIYLISYLLSHAPRNKWKVIVADGSADAIEQKINDNPFAEKAVIDITNKNEREPLVARADIVVSLMPPHLHIHLAHDCLRHKKHLITSSYISPEMKAMDAEVKAAGLMFMCEMGLDPGIDHMTASQIIHSIQRVAASITSFKSYCGGLVAPENDDNPWHYKFTWNPRNIVTAGKAGAQYLHNGKTIDVPYEQIFENNKRIKVGGLGQLAYYPNRDSMRYLDYYELPDIKTFIRATLRYPGFCKAWNGVVALGLTDETDMLSGSEHSYASWLQHKMGYKNGISVPEQVAKRLSLKVTDSTISMMDWLGLFDTEKLPEGNSCSANILLNRLLTKWEMKPEEKDMVVMQHEVEYLHKNKKIKLTSSMVLKGEDREHSAMAKTVGLPMGILARLILKNKLNPPAGVHIPNMPSVYRPLLTELNHHGINFVDEVV